MWDERKAFAKDVDDVETQEQKGDEEIDIDLDDPDVEQAATKIQASFRGHQTRKSLKETFGSVKFVK